MSKHANWFRHSEDVESLVGLRSSDKSKRALCPRETKLEKLRVTYDH